MFKVKADKAANELDNRRDEDPLVERRGKKLWQLLLWSLSMLPAKRIQDDFMSRRIDKGKSTECPFSLSSCEILSANG
jgi:hypothetical protein